MSTTSAVSFPRSLWNKAWAISPVLTVVTAVMLIGAAFTTAGILLDQRQLVGEPVWLKPTKFSVSMAIYNATILYFLSFLAERRRLVRAVGNIIAAVGVAEIFGITLQAARGVRSHFNTSTPFDQGIFTMMGIAILVLWVTMVVLAVAMLRAKLADRTLASALRMGLVIGLVGAGLGWAMAAPRAEQIAAAEATGGKRVESGSHTFGAKDGGPGLPVVGWSTTAGDLRPAHFLGLHGMQVLPFLAALLARRRSRSESQRLALVRTAGVAYFGTMTALAIQALRALPITQWDMTGAVSFAVVVLASLVTFAVSISRKPAPALVAA
jgi:hypothetical protein